LTARAERYEPLICFWRAVEIIDDVDMAVAEQEIPLEHIEIYMYIFKQAERLPREVSASSPKCCGQYQLDSADFAVTF
jgi:hypothetical protein